jgi:hypothetical protein
LKFISVHGEPISKSLDARLKIKRAPQRLKRLTFAASWVSKYIP